MKKKIIRSVTIDGSLGFVEPMIPYLKDKYDLQILSSPGKHIDEVCRKYGLVGHRVYMYRRISPFKDLRSLWQLIKVFRKEKPDMVHSMTPKAGLLCMVAAWITRVPCRIHTFTGLVWPTAKGLSRRLLMFTDWVTCACATHIIPEGQGVKDDLSHITKKPMRVLGYGNIRGVDVVQFSRRPEIMEAASKMRDDRCFTFIFVGRMVGDKGINELIAAFCKLLLKHPDIRLRLVGSFEEALDPLRPETIDRIKQNDGSIEIMGSKYGEELIACYAASDCLVFPSYREGFPNVVLEAGAMGLPSIVTDINGSREIVSQGKNGIIIPPRDEYALYGAMEQMLTDKEATKRMAEQARPMIASRFERGFVCQCLYDFYDEVMR